MKFAGKWIVLEKLIQSEATQIQEDKHFMFSHVWMLLGFIYVCFIYNTHSR